MTPDSRTSKLNLMRCLKFGLLISLAVATQGRAQSIPGRELLAFPTGTLGAPVTLGTLPGHVLWNPATLDLPRPIKVRATVAALNSSNDQGVSAQFLSVSGRIREGTLVTLSLLQAGLSGMLRTDTDPQSLGGELRYGTTVISAGVAREHEQARVGAALRWRRGESGSESRSGFGIDAGVVLKDVGPRDLRVAASTFLWGPGQPETMRPRFGVAGDLRLVGADSSRQLRGGYELGGGSGLPHEHHLFMSGTFGRALTFGGMVLERAYGHSSTHLRLGVGLRYARYTVGIAREVDDGGVGSSYQFLLSADAP